MNLKRWIQQPASFSSHALWAGQSWSTVLLTHHQHLALKGLHKLCSVAVSDVVLALFYVFPSQDQYRHGKEWLTVSDTHHLPQDRLALFEWLRRRTCCCSETPLLLQCCYIQTLCAAHRLWQLSLAGWSGGCLERGTRAQLWQLLRWRLRWKYMLLPLALACWC